MVALTKNRLSAQYGWFCHGRSYMVDNFRGVLIFVILVVNLAVTETSPVKLNASIVIHVLAH